eukprot:jgi/Botrbrau1/3317/Bobra.0048s0013.1
MAESPGFLVGLAKAYRHLDAGPDVSTQEFAEACLAIMPIFDHLGTVFIVAKHELNAKRESLVRLQDKLPTLEAVVQADIRTGTVTVKNSGARNLYRLLSGLLFITTLLEILADDATITLRSAATEAYNRNLASMHSYMVRTAIKASMYLLPNRDDFMKSIGETEATARVHAEEFVVPVKVLVHRVLELYRGTEMPRSDSGWPALAS